jgi:hypothetical protein
MKNFNAPRFRKPLLKNFDTHSHNVLSGRSDHPRPIPMPLRRRSHHHTTASPSRPARRPSRQTQQLSQQLRGRGLDEHVGETTDEDGVWWNIRILFAPTLLQIGFGPSGVLVGPGPVVVGLPEGNFPLYQKQRSTRHVSDKGKITGIDQSSFRRNGPQGQPSVMFHKRMEAQKT